MHSNDLVNTDRNLRYHPDYFIPSADLHLSVNTSSYLQYALLTTTLQQARGVRFCIHSYFLWRDSQYWREILSDEHSPGAPGSNEQNPVVLDEDPEDIASFFWVYYNPRYSIYETSISNWAAILRIAREWQSPNVQDFALSYLKTIPMDPSQRITIFQKYDVPFVDQLPTLVELASLDTFTDSQLASGMEISQGTLDSIRKAHSMFLEAALSIKPQDLLPLGTICEALSYEERSQIVAQVFGNVPKQLKVDLVMSLQVKWDLLLTDRNPTTLQLDNVDVNDCGKDKGLMADETPSDIETIQDWEIIRMGGRDGTSALTEHYTRFPVMRHDFILPYCLIISFMCALIA